MLGINLDSTKESKILLRSESENAQLRKQRLAEVSRYWSRKRQWDEVIFSNPPRGNNQAGTVEIGVLS